jgi:hypothetical protein
VAIGRWSWVAAAATVLALTLFGTFGLHPPYARQPIARRRRGCRARFR